MTKMTDTKKERLEDLTLGWREEKWLAQMANPEYRQQMRQELMDQLQQLDELELRIKQSIGES